MVKFNMFSLLTHFKSSKIHIAIYAIFLPITLIPATWNVDLIHDAAVMVPAGALVHGKELYVDVYSIFGPLSSWINYLPLKTFGVYLIAGRILGAILFWTSSLIFFFMLRKYIDYKLSLAISITWLITASGFITLNPGNAKLLFYTTNLGVLLMLLSFLIISSSKLSNNLNLRVLIASFIMMAGISTRIEFFLSWFFVLVLLVFFYKFSQLVYFWLIGGTLFITTYMLGLYITGVLPKFISSNIFYTKILAEDNNPFKNVSSIFYIALPFLLWAIPALILIVTLKLLNKVTGIMLVICILFITLSFSLIYGAYEQIIDKTYNGISFFRWLDLVMVNIPISYIGLLLVLFPISLLIRLRIIRNRINESKTNMEFDVSIIYLASSISIYPYLHNLSLSYAHAFVPIITLGLISLWKDKIVFNSNIHGLISKGILFTTILSSSIFLNNSTVDRYSYEIEFLKGMTDTHKEKAIAFHDKFALVQSKYLANDQFQLRCSEYLLAIDQNYYYPNRFYDDSGKYNYSWCGLKFD
jgi:hypothetical protein